MISFIVPAHNEEAWVGRCVSCIHSGAESLGEPHEIIVVDDASSDATCVAALKRQGRFAILAETVVTSGRKAREHSFWSLARLFICLILRGSAGLRSRRGLEYWYEPEREKAKF